ncbi:BON domain-containing protein [Nesterenkonia sp. E16_7]|uniref:BON domain-containing protein n=1 Tax=unclassified Nesterenkonia TaxID=2629769 RepID=UPI001A90DE25|nr:MULTISPECIES: BON domain-containing protein [unclassified Nesterenkonia]MBO0595931.1 BON domain-containing protein [Nesterenkonia sp. E16_10]MBO0599469.1 BON domain-containing protein [Nesterenkonia sp. E16_7]
MSTLTTASQDLQLQSAVLEELHWTPNLKAAGIGVTVHDSTVTLSGEVADSEYLPVKRAAMRVHGVSNIVDELIVRPKMPRHLNEAEIAEEIECALTWASNVPPTVRAQIDGANVTLTGEVDWDFQREAAQHVIAHLRGIHTVVNQISLTARPCSEEAVRRIRNALSRNAQLDATHITATLTGTTATLTGHVRSWAEKKQARTTAWSSPDVVHVDDRLDVHAH